jgi:DtxR family Mn-dependent transcriptional regulator
MKKDLTGRAEDYLRALYEIVEMKGYARIKDIARELDVQPSSAVEMMKKLHQMGFVAYEKYGAVTLTSQGKEIAKVIAKRHETFKKFLEIILVPKEIALKDSHILEHRLHPKTVLQFTRFVEFFTSTPERPKFVNRWLEQFKKYCEKEDQ